MATAATGRIEAIEALTKKSLWLASWMVHHANHIRPNVDGVKVGGHQASSASMATLLATLYFGVLRPEDRVAVKEGACFGNGDVLEGSHATILSRPCRPACSRCP